MASKTASPSRAAAGSTTKSPPPRQRNAPVAHRYRGAVTAAEVERQLVRTNFALYHRLPPADREPPTSLPLTVAYRTSTGLYRHYPLVTVEGWTHGDGGGARQDDDDDNCVRWRLFKVKCGDPDAPTFTSLKALIRHYEVVAYMESLPGEETMTVDFFPWWLDDCEDGRRDTRDAKPEEEADDQTAVLPSLFDTETSTSETQADD